MIYLDANVFIFAAINDGLEGDEAGELLNLLRIGAFSGCTSSLSCDELLWIVKKEKGKEESILACKSILNIKGLKILKVDKNTILESLDIIRDYNLKPRDAIHAASMNLESITEIVSNDKDFNVIKSIKHYTIKEFLYNLKKSEKDTK